MSQDTINKEQTHRIIQRRFKLHKRGEDNLPWGALGRKTRFDLLDVFNDLGFKEGAEIGVRRGGYSVHMFKHIPGLHLTCIDPWDAYHARYPEERQNRIYAKAVKNLSPHNVTIMRKSSMDALSSFEDGSLDFVFIDGNHLFDFVMEDILYWSKKVRPLGIVAVHDYYHFGWAGVVFAVDAYTRAHHIDPWYATKEREPTAFWVNK